MVLLLFGTEDKLSLHPSELRLTKSPYYVPIGNLNVFNLKERYQTGLYNSLK